VQGIDQDPGVGPADGLDDGGGGGEVAGLAPRRELEVDCEAEVECQVAQATEAVGGPCPVGIGKLSDHVPSADCGRGLEHRPVVVGFVVGSEPGQLDVEHLHARVGHAPQDLADHGRVADQRADDLALGDRCRADAGVVVARAGGDLEQLERRRAEHREVGEREPGGHGHGSSCRSAPGGSVP
jgi:hypothetical protein